MQRRRARSPGPPSSLGLASALQGVVNDPSSASTWLGWLGADGGSYDAGPPPLPPGTLPEVREEDFDRYLRAIGPRLDAFEAARSAAARRRAASLQRGGSASTSDGTAAPGQGAVAAMTDVPALFFTAGFDLDAPELWAPSGPLPTASRGPEGQREAINQLTGYLDTIELRLMAETGARAQELLAAGVGVQGAARAAAALAAQLHDMRTQVSASERQLAESVDMARQLSARRRCLLDTLDTLKAMEAVAQARGVLAALLGGGDVAGVGPPLAVDYCAAIDVLEVLQSALDAEGLLALACFRTLPEQIGRAAQTLEDWLTYDLLETTVLGPAAETALSAAIAERARQEVAAGGSGTTVPSADAARAAAEELFRATLGSGNSDTADPRLPTAAAEAALGNADVALAGGAAGLAGQHGHWGEPPVEALLPVVSGLLRMGRLSDALRALSARCCDRLRAFFSLVVNDCVTALSRPGTADGTAGSTTATAPSLTAVAPALGRLPAGRFQLVLQGALLAVVLALEHCARAFAAVEAALVASDAPPGVRDAAARATRDACQAVAAAAASRWAKLLGARALSKEAPPPSLPELRRLLVATDALGALVEARGVRSVAGLHAALAQTAGAALAGAHADSVRRLSALLDGEQWAPAPVDARYQALADALAAPTGAPRAAAAGGTWQDLGHLGGRGAKAAAAGQQAIGTSSTDAPTVPRTYTLGVTEEPSTVVAPLPAAANGAAPAQSLLAAGATGDMPVFYAATPGMQPAPGTQPTLAIGGRQYHVVASELVLLDLLAGYCEFQEGVPSLAGDAALRALELLKVFNSRTCQLVLGAGAMQVSGLRSITARHLAVAGQALAGISSLLPSLSSRLLAGLPAARAAGLASNFERLRQDYETHREELRVKLVSIMRERLGASIRSLPTLAAGWPASPPDTAGAVLPPSAFAATTVRQLRVLEGVLVPVAEEEDVAAVFSRLGHVFGGAVAEAADLLGPLAPGGEAQLRADVQYLLDCLRQLPMGPQADKAAALARLDAFHAERWGCGGGGGGNGSSSGGAARHLLAPTLSGAATMPEEAVVPQKPLAVASMVPEAPALLVAGGLSEAPALVAACSLPEAPAAMVADTVPAPVSLKIVPPGAGTMPPPLPQLPTEALPGPPLTADGPSSDLAVPAAPDTLEPPPLQQPFVAVATDGLAGQSGPAGQQVE